jgi:hypothetical protein
MPKERLPEVLNPRDEMLCESLLSFGFLSSEQIKKLHFPAVDKRTMLRRLRVLNKNKVLTRFESSKGGTVLWSLTSRQSSKMGSDFVMRNINRSALEHDLLVNDLRIQFETNGIGRSWRSSHYLRFKASQGIKREERLPETIPDWLVTLDDRVCALELELSFKGILRMERILNLYAEKKSIHQLWYFVPTEKIRQKLLFLANGYATYRGKHWVRVSLLSELTCHIKVPTGAPTV